MKRTSPYTPKRFQHFVDQLRKNNVPHKIIFCTLGIISTAWFLIRVIPKPSRAAYPCMQATAPYMSAFVLWLSGLGGGIFSYKKMQESFQRSNYRLAFVFLLIFSFSFAVWQYSGSLDTRASGRQQAIMADFEPNNPIGEAKGIFPGRVCWHWNDRATNENCDNSSNFNGIIDEGDNAWFMAKNNNPPVIDSMLNESLKKLTDKNDIKAAWDAIFRYYNESHGLGDKTYTDNEIIFIKINATTAYGGVSAERYYADLSRNDNTEINPFSAETNPFLVLAMLRQLTEEAGVPQDKIFIGDPARNIYKEFYELWKAQFPEVHYLGNNLINNELEIEALGRLAVAHTDSDLIKYSDHGTVMQEAIADKLFTVLEEMDYLINIPTMKAHASAGITLNAKNHFGSLPRTWAMHVHPGLMSVSGDDPQRLGYGLYRVQTDLMMHKLLGGKNLLMIVDGLYPGEDALGVPEKWAMTPFSNDWCSSLFVSLDPVAIESVCHDFLRSEYNGPTIAESRPNWPGVDDYLIQAADSSYWPEGIIYDPDDDGNLIASLGVHEHWNNESSKEYSRNLGIGDGIELIKVHELISAVEEFQKKCCIHIFPNPVDNAATISNNSTEHLNYQIIAENGKMHFEGEISPESKLTLNMSHLDAGLYIISASSSQHRSSIKFIKR